LEPLAGGACGMRRRGPPDGDGRTLRSDPAGPLPGDMIPIDRACERAAEDHRTL
jgi:hypothetical protein